MEYPLEVQLTCYKGLMAVAAKDAGYAARAANILAQAHASLMAQAENLSDTAARQRYFENIAVNREVLATWEAHQNSEKRS